jgi:hypothetical protein
MLLTILTVRQPWANAILAGRKDREFRTRDTRHRGLLGIHAALAVQAEAFRDYPGLQADRVKTGCLLGVVEIVGTELAVDDEGGYLYAWLLRNPCWFRQPVPLKGKLGLWKADIPDDAELDG